MSGPDSVPVASNLLESKFLGFSVRRVLESIAIPLAPCIVLYAIGFPLLVTFPLFVGGLVIGGTVFMRTPTGQKPLSWSLAVIRHRMGSNVYTWTRPAPGENDLAKSDIQDEWLTREIPPDQSNTASDTRASDESILMDAGDVRAFSGTVRGTAATDDQEGEAD